MTPRSPFSSESPRFSARFPFSLETAHPSFVGRSLSHRGSWWEGAQRRFALFASSQKPLRCAAIRRGGNETSISTRQQCRSMMPILNEIDRILTGCVPAVNLLSLLLSSLHTFSPTSSASSLKISSFHFQEQCQPPRRLLRWQPEEYQVCALLMGCCLTSQGRDAPHHCHWHQQ